MEIKLESVLVGFLFLENFVYFGFHHHRYSVFNCNNSIIVICLNIFFDVCVFYLFSQFFSSTVSLSEMSQSFASHHHFLMTGDKERTQIQNV